MLTTTTRRQSASIPPLSGARIAAAPSSKTTTTIASTTAATTPTVTSPFGHDWWAAAACRTVPDAKDLFFSDELTDMASAKRICADCPVIAPCLEEAIHRSEPCGVWGGQLFEGGRIVMIKRRRGRPPKHPRPEDQLPMIPVPEHLQKLIA